jgi:hypothetical protein
MRLAALFLGTLVLLGSGPGAWAASDKAIGLRQANGLKPFTPPEKFLEGNFVAEESNPTYIFGPVQAFVASRTCPTTWLIQEGAQRCQPAQGNPEAPAEYTLYLEEDCPGRVVYYVFVDQSKLTPQKWIDWRQRFHMSKTEEEYAATKDKLEQARKEGCGATGELRYIEENGDLVAKSPEAALMGELHFPPLYDLNKRQHLKK